MTAPVMNASKDLPGRIVRWFALRPQWTIVLILLATLGPFLTKPLNIDDPIFVWAGRQIQKHPGDPYGFTVNWQGTACPMWGITQNPPLACYYLALVATVVGWSELALHSAFLLPALAVLLGTHRLARRCCQRPLVATLVTLFAPAFLVSSTTLMCDVLMLAFWVWAAVLWVEGMDKENVWQLTGAGLLMGLAALTKYFGVCLFPLLAAYSLIARHRWRHLTFLLIPAIVLAAYELTTYLLYGFAKFSVTAQSSIIERQDIYHLSAAINGMTTLTFTGGCLAAAAIFAPWLWRPKALAIIAASAVLPAIAVFEAVPPGNLNALNGGARDFAEFQVAFWTIGGVCVLVLAVEDVLSRREPCSWLLGLWVLGTFGFTAFLNWTVNGRSLLPMAPAVGILVVRRLEQNAAAGRGARPVAVALCLAAGAMLALGVARADFLLANAACRLARETHAKYRQAQTLWFQGHWGFQYYMEGLGASALDFNTQPIPARGQIMAVPANNTNTVRPQSQVPVHDVLTVPGPRLLTTVSEAVGAGFYSSIWGPLPFAFGQVPPECVGIYLSPED
jgi:4-amino-4-deoxy-L-arabinose transferase-like glycosyltransferase